MMLSIDTSELKKVRLRVDDGKRSRRFAYAIYADSALSKIVKALGGKKPAAIGVVVGPGAWSATRTGVALANALAFAFGVPLAPLTKETFAMKGTLPPGTDRSAAVVYDAPPNITKKKTR